MAALTLPRLPPYPWPHCAAGHFCTMNAEERADCACPCLPCRVARWGVSRSGVYRYRWQWWAPWNVTDWWRPRVFKGGDEWCRVPACFVVPPLGCIVVFWRPGRRTMPCPEDWGMMGDSDRADYAPCGRYHGGRIRYGAHAHWETGVCGEAARWLVTARPE